IWISELNSGRCVVAGLCTGSVRDFFGRLSRTSHGDFPMNGEIAISTLQVLTPPPLQAGDRVRFVSPASSPVREDVLQRALILEAWGLQVDFGEHAFKKLSYLAGTDEERLSDLNSAFRDPQVRAVFTTRGGKGSY